jgi:cytoskeletal protein CcmA (bactofilin family)
MFSKSHNPPDKSASTLGAGLAKPAEAPPGPGGQRAISLIGKDITLTGDLSGEGEVQVDGTVKGDVRVERVLIGDTGHIEGGVFAEAVEVRGKVSGSITAKQVRLYGACHVDGDITHEQLAMETGAFFQGRSLRLQRPPSPTPAPPTAATKEPGGPDLKV